MALARLLLRVDLGIPGETVCDLHGQLVIAGYPEEPQALRRELDQADHAHREDGEGDEHFEQREAAAVTEGATRHQESASRLDTRPVSGSTVTR